MKANSYLIGLFLLSLAILPAQAQLGQNCYERFLKEGLAAQNFNDFDLALHKFEAALICPDKPLIHQLDSLLDAVNLMKIEALTKAKDRAKNSAAEAQKQLQISEGSRMAFLANQEREKGNIEGALKLAFRAMQTVGTPIPFAIQRAFGDVAYRASLKTLEGHKNGIHQIEFSKNGSQLLSVGKDSSIIVWDSSGKKLSHWKPLKQSIQSAHFSPDGQNILVASREKIHLKDLQGQTIQQFSGDQSFVYQAIFSHDGNLVAAGTRDHNIFIWDKTSAQLLARCPGIEAAVLELAFSKDDQYLLSLSADKAIRVWDRNGALVQKFTYKDLYFGGATFGSNSKQVISYTIDHSIQIWDIESGQLQHTFQAHQKKIQSLDVAPDQKGISTCSSDKQVIRWTLEGKALFRLDDHIGRVNKVYFSNDGAFLVSCSKDGTAKLFDQEGHLLMDLSGFDGSVKEASISPDNQRIAAIGPQAHVYLCQNPNYFYDYLKKHPPAAFTKEEKEKYILFD